MNYRVSQLDQVPPVPCPCGHARRAFASDGTSGERAAASVHLVDISVETYTAKRAYQIAS